MYSPSQAASPLFILAASPLFVSDKINISIEYSFKRFKFLIVLASSLTTISELVIFSFYSLDTCQ